MKHYGVLHGKYEGYSSIARNMLGLLDAQMGATNQKFGSWSRQLEDGAIVRISIIKNGAVPIYRAMVTPPEEEEEVLEVLGWSVESGMITVDTSGEGTAYTLTPLDAQRAQYPKTEHQLLDMYSGTVVFSYRDYLAAEMDSIALTPLLAENLRNFATLYQSFALTGKFALLVRAQMNGFKDTNYTDIITWLTTVRTVIAPQESVNSSYMLYTESFGRYVLVWFSGGTIRIRKVRPAQFAEGVTLIEELVATKLASAEWTKSSAEYQRYETYVLSVCDFVGDWYDLDTYSVTGEALYYGWKPTWRGTKASIVLHERGTGPITARVYTADFSPDAGYDDTAPYAIDNTPITSLVSLVSTADWVPRFNGDIIYTPGLALQASYFWFPYGCDDIYNATTDYLNVPIYCWYSHDNALVTVKFSRKLSDDVTNPWGNNPIVWKNNNPWPSNAGSMSAEMMWTTGGSSSGFSFNTGAQVETDPGYTDPAKINGSPGADMEGFTASAYTEYTARWVGYGIEDCDNYPGGLAYPVQCLRETDTISLNVNPPDPLWTTYDPVDIDYYCVYRDRAPVIAMLQSCEMYYHKRTGTITTKQCLVIGSGNAESAFLLSSDYRASTGYNFDEEGRGIAANKEVISGDMRYFKHYFSVWKGGTGGGCNTQEPPSNLPSYNGSVTEWRNNVRRVYADKWGQIEYEDIENISETGAVGEGNGLYDLFNKPVCAGADLDFTGYFLTFAGAEGAKFYQKDPGSLTYQNFSSNFGQEWETGNFKLFAGWQ